MYGGEESSCGFRWPFCALSFARHLFMSGAITEAVHTLTAILAGGGFATDCMFMVLVEPRDALLTEVPSIELCLFVDDLTIHAVGDIVGVGQTMAHACDRCVELLEDELDLTVSRSKTITVSSSKVALARLRCRLSRIGIATKSKTTLLGIDFSCGRRVVCSVQRGRILRVCARKKRYQQLGRKAAGHLAKTGAAPAFRYGASVYGASNAAVKAVRGFMCQVRGEMRGRSTFARLEVAGYDVGAEMATDPIFSWAAAAWDGLVADSDRFVTWKRAHVVVGVSKRRFAAVEGPAGAMLASCMRIGWAAPSHNVFRTARGLMLDLREVCPSQIRLHALDDLRRLEAAKSSLALRMGGPPDLEPLTDFLATRKVRKSQAAGSLAALGEGGWWTQARLFEEGRVGDPFCRACGKRGGLGPVLGTLHHGLCGCLATAGPRKVHRNQAVIAKAQSSVHGSEPLFAHGIPVLQPKSLVPTLVVRPCGGRLLPGDFTFTGEAFTDGAMTGRAPKAARRAGWACVLVDESGAVIGGLYGPCPDHFQTAFRAELRAVVELLMLAMPPVRVWTDNQEVVDGWCKGRTWCCATSRSAADLWRRFWAKIDDIGREGIEIVKVKGHATQGDIEAGRSTPFLQAGNDHADHFARRGAEIAEDQVPSQHLKDGYREARQWYDWLLTLCSHWPRDTDPRPKAKAKSFPRTELSAGASAAVPAGEVTDPIGAADIVVGTSVALPGSSHLLPGKCAVDRDCRIHASHVMRSAGRIHFCNACGSYAEMRISRTLRVVCDGHAAGSQGPKVSQLNNLRAGKHPLTGKSVGATTSTAARPQLAPRRAAVPASQRLRRPRLADATPLLRVLERLYLSRVGRAVGSMSVFFKGATMSS